MSNTEIESKIIGFLREMDFDEVGDKPILESNVETDLGMDSLDVIELIMKIENDLNLEISDVYAEEWRQVSVKEIARQVLIIYEQNAEG